jgi:hypothetical protein
MSCAECSFIDSFSKWFTRKSAGEIGWVIGALLRAFLSIYEPDFQNGKGEIKSRYSVHPQVVQAGGIE